MDKAAILDPETITKWVELGKRLFSIGAVSVEQFSWIIKLVHAPITDAEVRDILKQIEFRAEDLAKKADADAGPTVQREGEGL